jgi:hypothetical protein
MARGQKDKLYRSFNKGLITEAGFLTYPEDASIDELNTVLHRKGNRTRRLGIDYEPNDITGWVEQEAHPDATITEFFWRAAGNKVEHNFLVLQIDERLYFFDASADPLSSGGKDFTYNMFEGFRSPTATVEDVRSKHVSFASGKGILFVAHEYCDPFTIEYNPTTDTISPIRVQIMMRDFDGVNDNLANDEEPRTLSKEHHYNLRNQGWVPPGSPSVQGAVPGATPGPSSPIGSGSIGSGGGIGSFYNPYTGMDRAEDDGFPS